MKKAEKIPAAQALVSPCRKQFFHSLKMLGQLPGRCPGELWHRKKGGFVFWQQLFHALVGAAYWLRLPGDDFSPPFPGLRLYAELERDPVDQLSKHQLKRYYKKVEQAAEHYFARLTDSGLLEISPVAPDYTQLDVVLIQIRHLQYHVGHCNSILREADLPAAEWRE